MKVEEGYFDIIKGVEPKYKCKIKFIQNILIKMFGYKMVTEKKLAKKIEIKAIDYNFNYNDNIQLSFNYGDDVNEN